MKWTLWLTVQSAINLNEKKNMKHFLKVSSFHYWLKGTTWWDTYLENDRVSEQLEIEDINKLNKIVYFILEALKLVEKFYFEE